MIYKLMSVDDMKDLYGKVGHLTVKFPKSGKEFFCQGDSFTASNKIRLYQSGNGHEVVTSVEELLVEMTYQTYNLHKLIDDADYELALAVYEQYFTSPLDSDESRFAYLLSLIIADYEAEHYPMASLSTVDFIDYLLEVRQLEWQDLRPVLGYSQFVSTDFLRLLLEPDNIRIQDILTLSHFFRLPVQAFIVGGYGE